MFQKIKGKIPRWVYKASRINATLEGWEQEQEAMEIILNPRAITKVKKEGFLIPLQIFPGKMKFVLFQIMKINIFKMS